MGATTFLTTSEGKDAADAFRNAVNQAQWDYGHAGYTGTIAEKHEFVMIEVPEGANPRAYANALIDQGDPRIDDKWGPAGCIALTPGVFLFFGWASE